MEESEGGYSSAMCDTHLGLQVYYKGHLLHAALINKPRNQPEDASLIKQDTRSRSKGVQSRGVPLYMCMLLATSK